MSPELSNEGARKTPKREIVIAGMAMWQTDADGDHDHDHDDVCSFFRASTFRVMLENRGISRFFAKRPSSFVTVNIGACDLALGCHILPSLVRLRPIRLGGWIQWALFKI